ncbi:MAG: ATP synthase F1 subunit epsilon [Patescibacteria group bacterium]|jgi:F-type H+-transporting ATPase subunit epsilon
MSIQKIQLKLITPEAKIFEELVDEVRLPTELGQISILPEHTCLVTTLVPGELIVRSGTTTSPLAITGGVVEVFDNNLVVLADSAEHAKAIDVTAAEARAKDLALKLETESPEADSAMYRLLERQLEIERIKIETGKKWRK